MIPRTLPSWGHFLDTRVGSSIWIRGNRMFWTSRFRIQIRHFCTDSDPSISKHAKVVGKTLISTVLFLLYDFLSLTNNALSKSNKQNK
jgi:hypothetical protein